MTRLGFGKKWFACTALLAGGCGAIPDLIVDAALSSAREALQDAVADAVEGIVDDAVDDLLDLDDFEFLFEEQSEDEEDVNAFEDDGEEVEENDLALGVREGWRMMVVFHRSDTSTLSHAGINGKLSVQYSGANGDAARYS